MIKCDICGGPLAVNAGGQCATCKVCGMEHSIERVREMLKGQAVQPAEPVKPVQPVQPVKPAEPVAPAEPAYELPTAVAEKEYKTFFAGQGAYAKVKVEATLLPAGQGYHFVNKAKKYPGGFLNATKAGLLEAYEDGMAVDVQVALLSGAAHPVDSTPEAFHIAACLALRQALEKLCSSVEDAILDGEILDGEILDGEINAPAGSEFKEVPATPGKAGLPLEAMADAVAREKPGSRKQSLAQLIYKVGQILDDRFAHEHISYMVPAESLCSRLDGPAFPIPFVIYRDHKPALNIYCAVPGAYYTERMRNALDVSALELIENITFYSNMPNESDYIEKRITAALEGKEYRYEWPQSHTPTKKKSPKEKKGFRV